MAGGHLNPTPVAAVIILMSDPRSDGAHLANRKAPEGPDLRNPARRPCRLPYPGRPGRGGEASGMVKR